MLEIHLDEKDLLQVRFGYSPLIELTLSYSVLRRPEFQSHYRRWVAEAYCLLDGLEFPYMDAVIPVCYYIADFVTPTPENNRHTFEGELERIRQTPLAVVVENIQTTIEVDGTTPAREHFLHDPAAALDCLNEELRLYWYRVLAHHWVRLHALLEGDILYQAKRLALVGVNETLADLSQLASYAHNSFTIHRSGYADHYQIASISPEGRGLQLVPSIFSSPTHKGLHWQINNNWQPMIIYGARGVGSWLTEPALPTDEALELTLGASKARLLQALEQPTNTSELAHNLHLTAGSVSQQLAKLSQAGLVESSRSGSRVFYRLSPRGEKLLGVFT